MSLNCFTDKTSIKVLSLLLFTVILASCGVSKSSLSTKNKSSVMQEDILVYSKKYLGKPYRFAGKGPNSFDCSGFTSFVFRNFGYKLNTSSSGQDKQFPTISRKEDLIIGDLVFFEGRRKNGHVGHVGIVTTIYPNNDFKFIHSSTTSGVIISSSTEPYYSSRYLRGGRVLEETKINASPQFSNKKTEIQPNPPVPILIMANNSSSHSDTKDQDSEKVRSNLDLDNKLNKNEKKKRDSEKKKEAIDVKSDVILREDTHLLPLPVKIHTVMMGDTLYSISRQYGCTVEDLIAWNPQLGDVIKTGEEIQITKH